MTATTVHDLLIHSADRAPESRMLFEGEKWWDYRSILSIAGNISRYLVDELRIARGSRVAVYWDNSAGAIASAFAVWLSGCVLVPLNTEIKGDDLAYQIIDSDSACVITGRRQARHLVAIADKLQTVEAVLFDGPQPGETAFRRIASWNEIAERPSAIIRPVRSIDVDLAAIVYTSGSTGEPKGVMLSHLNLVSNMRSIVEYLQLTPEDSIMMVLPHFYIYGLSLVLTHTLVGGGIVLDNRFMYPNTVLEAMVEREVTGFAGVPATFSLLLGRSVVRDMSFPSLRYVTQAGGAMPAAVQKEVAEVFAPAKLYVMYGATEASPRLSYVPPDLLPSKWGSIGVPVPNVDLFVADHHGNRLPPGEEGEIVARGSNITRGYWKDSEETDAALRHGLYFTGDLGTMDDDGYLFITGRSKDILKVKGFRVSPKEIEDHIAELPHVQEVAVVGVSDEVLGEAPVAVIVSRDPDWSSEDDIRAHLAPVLPAYKMPVEYRFVESLPKGASGKVDKKTLREELQGET